jgi:branched-chain amino acid transport system substrate-binding protein
MKTGIKIILAIIIAAIVIAAIVTGAWYVNRKDKNNSTAEPIRIGAVLPLTGQTQMYGQYNKEGMELALAEINNQGGIAGRPLEIIYEDTTSNVTAAVSAIQKMINVNKILVIITSASSPETLAEAPIAEVAKAVLIACGSAASKVRDAGDYIFRLKVSVDKEVQELQALAAGKFRAKNAYLLYVQNDYGESVKQAVTEVFPASGIKLLGLEGFKLEESDYRSFLIKVKEANPDIVVLVGWPKNLGYIMKQAKELGINKQFIAPAGAIGPDITAIAGPAADGLIYTMEFNLNDSQGSVKKFIADFHAKYNKDPELFAAMGYDAVKIIAEAIKVCGFDSTCVKDNLYKVQNYDGGSGLISFDDHGDVMKPMIFMTIKDGQFVPLEQK